MAARLLKSTLVTGGMTSVSRVFGLVRDIVLAVSFGAGLDAFLVAFRMPNLLRRLFAEGAFVQSFAPVLGEYRERRGRDEIRALLDQVSAVLGGGLSLLAVLGVAAAPLLVALFAPGFLGTPQFPEAVAMLRLTLPYLPLISLVALAGAVLNVYGRFAAPAFAPVLLNLSLIGCALWLSPLLARPVHALAWGVLLAGVLQFLFLLPFLRRLGLLPRPALRRDPQGARRIFRLMGPALFSASVFQLNGIVDMLLASFLTAGSISWLYYADRLMEFPLGVFGIALGTVLLPSLAAHHARRDTGAHIRLLDRGLRWALLIGVPAALGLVVLAEPIGITIFQYERFSAEDARRTAAALAAYSLGLPAMILAKILAAGYHSRQDTATPARIGLFVVIANLLLNLLLIGPLGHVGLALATALAATLNAGLLYRGLRRLAVFAPRPGWGRFLLRVALACLAMVLLLQWQAVPGDVWLQWPAWRRAASLAGVVAAGAAAYGAAFALLGGRPPRLEA